MPKIPTYTADVTARTQLPNGELFLRGDEYGSELRRGAAQLTDYIEKTIRDEEELHVSKTVADARSQFYERLRKKAEETQPGAPNFTAEFMAEYDDYAAKALDGGTPYTRKQLQVALGNVRTSLFQSATDFEAKARVEKRKDDVREAVNKLGNSLINAPHTFAAVLVEADRTADAAGLPPRETTALKKQIREGLSAITVSELIRQNPGGTINRLKSGEFDDYLDPAKKSSLLDHANSEMRRRAAEARMIQAATRGNQQIDLQDYIAARKTGDTDAPLPPSLSEKELDAAGWRPDQKRRIMESIKTADAVGLTVSKIRTTPYEGFAALGEEAKKFAASPDSGLGAKNAQVYLAEVYKALKMGEHERAALGSHLLRQAFANAYQFKETLVEGDPQGQHVYVSQKPTYEEWRNAVAPVMGENWAKNAYGLIEKAGATSPERLPALFENLEKATKPSDALYAADRFVAEEITKRDAALKDHAGDYVLKNRPEVKSAWSDFARITAETKEGSPARMIALRNAIDITLSAQRELGVINPRLPEKFVTDFVDQMKNAAASNPQSASVMLRQMEQTIGPNNMPAFLRSIVKSGDTPPEIRVALLQDKPTGVMAAEIMSTLGLDMEKIKKQVPKENHQDLERAVDGRVAEVISSLPFAGDGFRTRGDIHDVSTKLAYKYVSQGKSVAEAARMATRWIDDQYNFHHVNGTTIRVPKAETVYGATMSQYLKKLDVDIAVPPGLTRDDVLGAVRAFGGFLSDPSGRGVLLVNRNGQILNDTQGRQIFIPWSAFSKPPAVEPGEDMKRAPVGIQKDYDKKFRDAYDPRRYAPERYR